MPNPFLKFAKPTQNQVVSTNPFLKFAKNPIIQPASPAKKTWLDVQNPAKDWTKTQPMSKANITPANPLNLDIPLEMDNAGSTPAVVTEGNAFGPVGAAVKSVADWQAKKNQENESKKLADQIKTIKQNKEFYRKITGVDITKLSENQIAEEAKKVLAKKDKLMNLAIGATEPLKIVGAAGKALKGAEAISPLEQEARKYKTAEEFVKSANTVNPSEKGVFQKYAPELRNKIPIGDNIQTLDKSIGGKPDDIITVYRGTSGNKINAGDFVTTNKQLAKDYAGTGNVVELKVRKGDVIDTIDEAGGEEYIYKPNADKLKSQSNSQLTDIWNNANKKTAGAVIKETQIIEADRANTIKLSQEKPSLMLPKNNLDHDLLAIPKNQKIQEITLPKKESSKTVSYSDTITQPIKSSQEAKQAEKIFSNTPKNPVKEYKYPKLVETADKYKDISGFKGQARDVYRNFRQFFGTKFFEAKKAILDPFDAAKGRFVDEEKKLSDSLNSNIVKKLGISKGSKESEAVMDYGEKLITKEQLIKKFGENKANKIIEADTWFRKEYDRMLDEVNTVRAEIYPNNPDKLIPKRQDYYRHYKEMAEGWEGLKNAFETPSAISPALSGISPFTKPKSKFLSFAQRRLGFETDRDAVGGFLNYLKSFSYAKHIDPQIGQFRKLADELAQSTEQSRNANNFIEFLQDFANDLSGKTNPMDRYIQKVIPGGRTMFRAIDWLNSRVKANTVLGNLSSSIAQIFNVPQGIASAKQYSANGAVRTIGQIFTKNEPMARSVFIKERYAQTMFDKFETGMIKDTKKFAVWLTGVLDEVGTKFIWNSHYAKALAQKMDNPIKYADDITRNLVAGRGIGEVPLIQKSRIFQLVAPFQLEVGNLWYVMGDFVKAKDFAGLATLFAANYLMNNVAEQIRGNNVVFDPINAVMEGIATLQNEEDKKLGALKMSGRISGEVLSNIPLGQTIASTIVPEEKRKEFFGSEDPTRFGSGILATKGLQDPLFKVLPGFGGAQIKKTYQGIQSIQQGGSYDSAGHLQFNQDQSLPGKAQSIMFGKYAGQNSQNYFNSGGKSPKRLKVEPIYAQVQQLVKDGKKAEAQKIVNELSDADYEAYKNIKQAEKTKQTTELKKKIKPVYDQIQKLKNEGKIPEAKALLNGLTDEEYRVYKLIKESEK